MPTTNLFATILRFAFGLSGGVGFSFLLFRQAIFNPNSPVFECLTASVVLAGILALLRSDRQTQAGALAVAVALLRLGFAQSQGWTVAIAGVLLTGGDVTTGQQEAGVHKCPGIEGHRAIEGDAVHLFHGGLQGSL